MLGAGCWVLGTCWREDSDEVRQELGGGQAAGATSAVSCPCSCSWLLAWPSPAQRTATQPGSQGPRDGKYDSSGVSCIKILNFCPIIKIKLGIRIVQVKVLKVLNDDGENVPAVGGEAVAVLAAILLTPPL